MVPLLLSTFLAVVSFDHSSWDQFLKKYVNDKGEIHYAAAQSDPSLLDTYLQKVKEIPFSEVKTWPREERIALWVNVFNAGVVHLILKHYPVKTAMRIPGFWEDRAIRIGSSNLFSLSQIENDILRQGFRDEKILFGLSKGAKDSPRLRPEAYTGAQVEGQLYLATREFVNDERRNRIDPLKKKVMLSRLFKWNSQDFLINWSDFPEPSGFDVAQMSVLSFFAYYLQDPKKIEFLKEGKYKVKYQDFDWDLNDTSKTSS